jgi:hypothetical protein
VFEKRIRRFGWYNVVMGDMRGSRRWRLRRRREPQAEVSAAAQAAQPEPVVADDLPDAEVRWVRRYAQVQVRSGLFGEAELRELVGSAATGRIADAARAGTLAGEALDTELSLWREEAATWLGRTDTERLDAALDRLADKGVLVLAAAGDSAEIEAAQRLRGGSAGTVGYDLAGVASALRYNILPLVVIEADGTAAPRAGDLAGLVQDALADEGLLASSDGRDGELFVPLTWRRRPPSTLTDGANGSAEPAAAETEDQPEGE